MNKQIQKPDIPKASIEFAEKRIEAWEENPQAGVKIRMMFHPDRSPLYVMFSFQHESAATQSTPVELWNPDFIWYFREAERMYLGFSKKITEAI